MKYKFKLEDIAIAKQLFAKGDYLFTFDLKSAYHHVEICPDHRTYLGFSWIHGNEIVYYVFNVLPFGVSTAAYIFTKVTRVMVAYWRRQGYRIAMYIDDGCGAADTLSEAMVVSNEVRSSTIKFGFLIAEEKCQWLPSNNVTWLGHILDMEAGIICVTDDRVKGLLGSIKELLLQVTNGNIYVKVRIAASIVGKIISMHNAIGPLVRLKTRCLYTCIETRSSWSGLIKIDSKALDELMFWLENITSLNGKVLHKIEHASVLCFSDASGTGYGGFVVEHDRFDHMGLWSFDEQSTSSTWRELEAVARVLNANKECLSNQLVQWFTDNQNVVRILEAGSKVPHLHRKALEIYDNCQGSGIRLWPEWIPRGLNARADMLSKGGDCDDWTISREAFAFVDSEFGPHTIDRFASGYNCKCVRFNSKWHFEGTEGIDAFAQSWKDDNNWLVPPPRLATFVLQKLEADSGYGTLVVPEWSSAPFWSKLCNIHGLFHTFVKGSIVMDANDIIVKGRGKNGVFGLSLGERVKDSIRSKDTELVRLAGLLPSILVGSRSENTSRKYWSYFKKWEQFAKDRGNLSVLPGNSVHVALYLTSLVEAKASISIISSAFYSIKWAHNLAGELDPTSHPFVINVLENAKRTCSKPVIKKDPVNSEHLINLCEKYKDTVDLLIVRDLAMMLLCYCGFFRFNELINLRCNNISMFDNYISCTILKSKTDQFRLGSQVLISKLKSVACPYNMLVRYINLARLDLTTEIFVFRSVIRSGVACKLSSVNKSLSYTRTREVILGRLKEVEKNGNFGLHSLRAGGATAAANANVLDRCFKRHGRWRSETAKDGYVADSIESRLKVSQNLGL